MSDETTTVCTPPDESPPANTPDDSITDSSSPDTTPTKPKYDYTSSTSRCVICGGRHDRRDKYGKAALCAQCLSDLRHESLSRIAPAVLRDVAGKKSRLRRSRGGEGEK